LDPQAGIRVVLTDDHDPVRQGLHRLPDHTADIQVVGEAVNGQEVLDQIARHHPDVLVIDLRMPVMGWAGSRRSGFYGARECPSGS
jgi:DNA-binding NarL/FixJ family response regulator